jgi:hypothetical protein
MARNSHGGTIAIVEPTVAKATVVHRHTAAGDQGPIAAEPLSDRNVVAADISYARCLERLHAPANVGPEVCPLLDLPAELREYVWMYAVTEWQPLCPVPVRHDALSISPENSDDGGAPAPKLTAPPHPRRGTQVQKPIRMDRFNRPLPPPLTMVSHQTRQESLPLYYQHNIFECWRPLFWHRDWSHSTLIDWLHSLTPRRTTWLSQLVLLYKHEDELAHDIRGALTDEGLALGHCNITDQQELTEYEMCFEELGLPRYFGKRKWHWAN